MFMSLHVALFALPSILYVIVLWLPFYSNCKYAYSVENSISAQFGSLELKILERFFGVLSMRD